MANIEISAGLRADIMRRQMECKNTLKTKGSLYVGLGAYDSVSGVNIYKTDCLLAGTDGQTLLADSTQGLGLKWGKLNTSGLEDYAVTSSKIDSSAVTTVKIADRAVNTNKLDTEAVTEGKIAGNAVTTNKIKDKAVTNAKIDKAWIKIGTSTINLGGTLASISNEHLTNSSTTLGLTTLVLGSTTDNLNMGSGNITAAHYYTGSDRRFKKNIVDYIYHDSILDIPVHEFDYKDNDSHAIGFIAQELQEKYPELVFKNEEGYLEIAETKLVYLLIKEVQKLRDQLNSGR